MALFKKKQKKSKQKGIEETSLKLPELPKLPEFPLTKKEKIKDSKKLVPKLPSFPTNSLGEKFSQDIIKEAVTGEKEGEEVFNTDDFAQRENERRMMQKPLKKPLTKELYPLEKRERAPLSKKIIKDFKGASRTEKAEPVFIRIDKFEESLQIFGKIKEQFSEIEKMLEDIIRIKEEEERELSFWERKIQAIKKQFEKIDEDLFSKIE